MANYKAFLIKLTQNLNILRECEAKYSGNAPLELLNQIADHQEAMYEFKRNRRHQSAFSRLETMIAYLYAYLAYLSEQALLSLDFVENPIGCGQ